MAANSTCATSDNLTCDGRDLQRWAPARAHRARHTIRTPPDARWSRPITPEVCCGAGAPVRSPGRRGEGMGHPAGHRAGRAVFSRGHPRSRRGRRVQRLGEDQARAGPDDLPRHREDRREGREGPPRPDRGDRKRRRRHLDRRHDGHRDRDRAGPEPHCHRPGDHPVADRPAGPVRPRRDGRCRQSVDRPVRRLCVQQAGRAHGGRRHADRRHEPR